MADNSTVPRKDTLPTYLIIILRYLNLDRSSSITFSKVEVPFVPQSITHILLWKRYVILLKQSYIILLKQFFYIINLYTLLFFLLLFIVIVTVYYLTRHFKNYILYRNDIFSSYLKFLKSNNSIFLYLIVDLCNKYEHLF